jgi:hypothetical protein
MTKQVRSLGIHYVKNEMSSHEQYIRYTCYLPS